MTSQRKVHVLCPTDFDPTSLGFLTAPFQAANELSDSPRFELIYVSNDGSEVRSKTGWSVTARALRELEGGVPSLVVLVEALWPQEPSEGFAKHLRYAHRHGAQILATGSAVFALGKVGLLNGKACSVGSLYRHAFKELHVDVHLRRQRYTIDGNIGTAMGGIAALDVSLQLVARDVGDEMARRILRKLTADSCSDLRSGTTPAAVRMPTTCHRTFDKVLRIVDEADDPAAWTSPEMAACCGLSVRQLERLFRSHLNCTPKSYVMRRRLEKARQLLYHTALPVVDIAVACGFVSSPHFTRAYKKHFDVAPAKDRVRSSTAGSPSSYDANLTSRQPPAAHVT